jgi:hypothetical protein
MADDINAGDQIVTHQTIGSGTAHRSGRYFLDYTGSEPLGTLDLGETADSQSIRIYKNGLLEPDYTQVNGQFLNLATPLAAGDVVVVHYQVSDRKYRHDVPIRTDKTYGYSGQLYTFESLRDKLVNPATTLTLGQDVDLDYIFEESTTLRSDVALPAGWFINARVDEQTAQRLYGDLLGVRRETSEEYAKMIGALVTAQYAASTKETIENFGSGLLGSPITQQESRSLGVRPTASGMVFTGQPTNLKDDPFEITLLDDAPMRVLPEQKVLPRFWALNDLVEVIDGENLTSFPYLVHFAEEISDEYRFAKRLDVTEPNEVNGLASYYNAETGLLVDNAQDFIAQEVHPGDTIAFVSNVLETGDVEVVYQYDGQGFAPYTSLEFKPSTDSDVDPVIYPYGQIRVNLTDSTDASEFEIGQAIGVATTNPEYALADESKPYIVTAIDTTGTAPNVTTVITATFPNPTAPTDTILNDLGESIYGAALKPLTTNLALSSFNTYRRVQRVVDNHTIELDYNPEVETLGFGGGVFSQSAFGGGTGAVSISNYRIFSRKTRTLDGNLYLDQALPKEAARVTGEDIDELNKRIVSTLKNHAFVVKYNFQTPRTQQSAEDLANFVDRVKPAETKAFIYSEAFEHRPIVEHLEAQVQDGDVEYAGLDYVNGIAFFVGSAIAHDTPSTLPTAYRTNPGAYALGGRVETVATSPETIGADGAIAGRRYIVAPDIALLKTSLWGQTFSVANGLGDMVVRSESDGSWVMDSGLDLREGGAIDLWGSAAGSAEPRLLEISDTPNPTKTNPTPSKLEFSAGQTLMIECWIEAGTFTSDQNDDRALFRWGPLQIRLVTKDNDGNTGTVGAVGNRVRPEFRVQTDIVANPAAVALSTGDYSSTVGMEQVNTDISESDGTEVPNTGTPLGSDLGFLLPDQFVHLLCVYSDDGADGTLEIYINGILTGANDTAAGGTSLAAALSSDPDYDNTMYIGALDAFDGTGNDGNITSRAKLQQFMLHIDPDLGGLTYAEYGAAQAAKTEIESIGVQADGTVIGPATSPKILYQFFETDRERIRDYSGNGFEAVRKTQNNLTVNTDWSVPGYLGDYGRREGDVYTLGPAASIYKNGIQSTTQIIEDSFVPDEDDEGELVAGGYTQFVIPNTWIGLIGNSWGVLPSAARADADSVSLDESTL